MAFVKRFRSIEALSQQCSVRLSRRYIMDRSSGSRFRVLLCVAATAIGAPALVITDARAQGVLGAATVATTNSYGDGKSIWITIYDLGKTSHLDWGCVSSAAERDWRSGTYLYGSFYHVRAEVKAGPNCGGATICDTTVQINPQSPGPVIPGGSGYNIFHGTEVTLLPNGNKCYWRHDN
jgi:hypothetical protein